MSTRRHDNKKICTRIKDKFLIGKRMDKENMDEIIDIVPYKNGYILIAPKSKY